MTDLNRAGRRTQAKKKGSIKRPRVINASDISPDDPNYEAYQGLIATMEQATGGKMSPNKIIVPNEVKK